MKTHGNHDIDADDPDVFSLPSYLLPGNNGSLCVANNQDHILMDFAATRLCHHCKIAEASPERDIPTPSPEQWEPCNGIADLAWAYWATLVFSKVELWLSDVAYVHCTSAT
jgi:hypothetical protein